LNDCAQLSFFIRREPSNNRVILTATPHKAGRIRCRLPVFDPQSEAKGIERLEKVEACTASFATKKHENSIDALPKAGYSRTIRASARPRQPSRAQHLRRRVVDEFPGCGVASALAK